MPLNRGTQKQIAQRFKGNLDYFRKPHYWRRLRFLTILVVCVVGILAMAWFYVAGNDAIYNPGPISQHHAAFAHDCSKCHETPSKTLAGATFKFTNEAIDERCQKCHPQHSFHQPNVVTTRSCTACHQEHEGAGPMLAPGDAQCARCHNNPHEMRASAEKGAALAASLFDFRPAQGRRIFPVPRPAEGFTATFESFADGHPEFRLVAERSRETNTLRFNHRRHLFETNDIPLVNGKRMDCQFCHSPGPGGAFFQRISFEQHCRVCHDLQFDVQTPELKLPHGRAEHVRAFLRSLPTHYAAIAEARSDVTRDKVDAFVAEKMQRLRRDFTDGTNLEQTVFFTAQRQSPHGRAAFDGCAKCHEVRATAVGAPVVTTPAIPDRWMARAQFDHGKHSSIACTHCHDARRSSETADIIMPSKATCVDCHSPKGKVSSQCSLCHSYHNGTVEALLTRPVLRE